MRNKIESLIKLLHDDKVTGYELHHMTGISKTQVYKIKNGVIKVDNISLKNAEILCDAYDKISVKK